MIKTGITYRAVLKVTAEQSAERMGSGDLPVLATPALIALMEQAAMKAVAPYLQATESSVGVFVNCRHTRATAIGDEVYAEACVTGVDGRRISFEITACDSRGEIGRAEHDRFVVDRERFLSKLK